ncbi:MAG TPA: 1-acyl-sn-glycerol-3-phosphate acyltransferase [Pyrinomonadaceae bacterium]|nr:1-acyl-sn-glycerol-3-phosphate acyltransferase [Pyrinomonadaceae bacterium]
MVRVIVIDDRDTVAELIADNLRDSLAVELCQRAPQKEDGFGGHLSGGYAELLREQSIDTVVYSPPQRSRNLMSPDLQNAELVFQECARASVRKFILLSSAMVYGASPHNEGLVPETHSLLGGNSNPVASGWRDLEALAASYFGPHSKSAAALTILRTAAVLVPGGKDYFSRLFSSRIAITLPGHDPTMQLLSPNDLARAVRCVIENSEGGIYNLAPKGVITLRAALRLVGARRVPVSRVFQRAVRLVMKHLGLANPIEQLDYIRYSWTISDERVRSEFSCSPQRSSPEALAEFFLEETGETLTNEQEMTLHRGFDDFGMDKHYIAAYGRTLFKFMHDYYWRVEVQDIQHVPRRGRAVLVGVHRGFMPWDAVMTLHYIVRQIGRYPRFLIHPSLIKFPFLFNFHTKLGGIVACQKNADYVLERDEMLAIYPEGIRGAFKLYRDAHHLSKFGRGDFVKMALRNRAPIVPFITLGNAEIFPILKKFDWGGWKRLTEWPAFPITPTFPFLPPVPLPSKWHTRFLEPIHLEDRYPPETADDQEMVRAISEEVRGLLAEALVGMLRRRKSIFYGSIFQSENGTEPQRVYSDKPGFKRKEFPNELVGSSRPR